MKYNFGVCKVACQSQFDVGVECNVFSTNKQTKTLSQYIYTATPGGGGGIDVAVVALSSGDAFVFDLLRFCSLVCSLDSFSIVDDLCVSR